MAKPKKGEINKSQAIRDLIQQTPKITANEAIEQLKSKNIKIRANLFYFVKGKLKGAKGRRRKMRRHVESVMGGINGAAAKSDALTTIKSIQALAGELGGMKKLAALVEALSGA